MDLRLSENMYIHNKLQYYVQQSYELNFTDLLIKFNTISVYFAYFSPFWNYFKSDDYYSVMQCFHSQQCCWGINCA